MLPAHRGAADDALCAMISIVVVPGPKSVIVELAWANVSKNVNSDLGTKLGDEVARNTFAGFTLTDPNESPASVFFVTVMPAGIVNVKFSWGVSTLFQTNFVKSEGTNSCGLVLIVQALCTVTTSGASVWHVVLVLVMETVALMLVVPGLSPFRVIW